MYSCTRSRLLILTEEKISKRQLATNSCAVPVPGQAILLKADALYSVGDLEEALVFYQRGRRLRPTISNFRLGIERTEKAIMECVGGN